MAATNFILGAYQKIWTLLEAHTPVTNSLRVGNEEREDQNKLQPRRLGGKQPADFPRLSLTSGTTNGSLWNPTFIQEESWADADDGGWLEDITQTYEIKIVHEACDLTANSLFELEVLTALRKGGPRLGLSYVVGWTYSSQRIETTKGAAAGKLRQITTITIPVRMQFEGSQLIT